MSKGSFYSIVSTLTKRDSQRKGSVDYVVSALVYDNFALLRQITKSHVPHAHRKELLDSLEKAEWFLKHIFAERHIKLDDDGYHDCEFALKSPACRSRTVASARGQKVVQMWNPAPREVNCTSCQYPFAVIDKVGELAATSENSGVSSAIAESKKKVFLFLGHLHRKKNQQRAIQEMFDELVEEKLHNRIVVLIDYKMKY